MNDIEDFLRIAFLIVIAILLFLTVVRMFILWYYKVNYRIKLQEHNNFLLEKLLTHYGVEFKNSIEAEPIYTVKHIESNKVSTVNQKTWDAMKKSYGVDAYEVISYK